MQDFVKASNSRNLASNKVIKKDVPRLISLRAEQSMKSVRRPKLYVDVFVRLAKVAIPFRKGYKQSFSDEVLEVFDIPTRNSQHSFLLILTENRLRENFTSLN